MLVSVSARISESAASTAHRGVARSSPNSACAAAAPIATSARFA